MSYVRYAPGNLVCDPERLFLVPQLTQTGEIGVSEKRRSSLRYGNLYAASLVSFFDFYAEWSVRYQRTELVVSGRRSLADL